MCKETLRTCITSRIRNHFKVAILRTNTPVPYRFKPFYKIPSTPGWFFLLPTGCHMMLQCRNGMTERIPVSCNFVDITSGTSDGYQVKGMSDCHLPVFCLWIPLEHRKMIRHGESLRGCILSKQPFQKCYRCFSFAKPPRKLHTPAKLTAGTQKWTWKEADVLVQSGDFQDVPSWELAYPLAFGTFDFPWFSQLPIAWRDICFKRSLEVIDSSRKVIFKLELEIKSSKTWVLAGRSWWWSMRDWRSS